MASLLCLTNNASGDCSVPRRDAADRTQHQINEIKQKMPGTGARPVPGMRLDKRGYARTS
jgi:hypothetical protein